MALLQLAENGYNHLAENEMYLAETGAVVENYLFIPAGMFGVEVLRSPSLVALIFK